MLLFRPAAGPRAGLLSFQTVPLGQRRAAVTTNSPGPARRLLLGPRRRPPVTKVLLELRAERVERVVRELS